MTTHEHNNVNHEPHPERGQASAILVPSERDGHKKHTVGLIAIAVVCVAVAIAVYSGIHTRLRAETALTTSTEKSAIQSVTVTYAKSGSDAQEIVLPGITQAFTDTPIYARTSGYLEKWYVDIGSHVSKGQLLAEIETPELDQQVQQAQADLKNAQANLQLAQITAARWKHLLEIDSVSKQETDQAVSDLSSKEALVSSSVGSHGAVVQRNTSGDYKTKDGWKMAHPSDQAPRGDWWEIYGDPQLNALEAQIDASNQTLKTAEANFRQRVRPSG
jgi:multidrug efflux pump subunit AcrA (membrane-fusion protein)